MRKVRPLAGQVLEALAQPQMGKRHNLYAALKAVASMFPEMVPEEFAMGAVTAPTMKIGQLRRVKQPLGQLLDKGYMGAMNYNILKSRLAPKRSGMQVALEVPSIKGDWAPSPGVKAFSPPASKEMAKGVAAHEVQHVRTYRDAPLLMRGAVRRRVGEGGGFKGRLPKDAVVREVISELLSGIASATHRGRSGGIKELMRAYALNPGYPHGRVIKEVGYSHPMFGSARGMKPPEDVFATAAMIDPNEMMETLLKRSIMPSKVKDQVRRLTADAMRRLKARETRRDVDVRK